MITHRISDENGDYIEIDEQYQTGDVVLAEAKITLRTDVIEGTMTYFVGDVEEIDELIGWLTSIRNKMVKHYQDNPINK